MAQQFKIESKIWVFEKLTHRKVLTLETAKKNRKTKSNYFVILTKLVLKCNDEIFYEMKKAENTTCEKTKF